MAWLLGKKRVSVNFESTPGKVVEYVLTAGKAVSPRCFWIDNGTEKEADIDVSIGKSVQRKRTFSMTMDLLELEDLSLADDIITRRRLFDMRCVKRKFFNRKVIFNQCGFILDDYLSTESH